MLRTLSALALTTVLASGAAQPTVSVSHVPDPAADNLATALLAGQTLTGSGGNVGTIPAIPA